MRIVEACRVREVVGVADIEAIADHGAEADVRVQSGCRLARAVLVLPVDESRQWSRCRFRLDEVLLKDSRAGHRVQVDRPLLAGGRTVGQSRVEFELRL